MTQNNESESLKNDEKSSENLSNEDEHEVIYSDDDLKSNSEFEKSSNNENRITNSRLYRVTRRVTTTTTEWYKEKVRNNALVWCWIPLLLLLLLFALGGEYLFFENFTPFCDLYEFIIFT